MTVRFARGDRALGICDRCGFTNRLNDLRYQAVAAKVTKLRVCSACMDVDHPQLLLGRFPVNDPVALRDPRPDAGEVSTFVFGIGILGADQLQ